MTIKPGRLDTALSRELQQLESTSSRRSLRALSQTGKVVQRNGKRLLNLAGNDYLGLAQHPAVIEAAKHAAQQHGVGSGASRLVTGTLDAHEALEQRFASLKHAEAALLFPSGYTANLAVLTALARPGDVVLQDKLNHASLIDAARFSGATVRTFPHLGYDKLEALLQKYQDERAENSRVFIVTDTVFSMDGDTADLPRLACLAERYDAVNVIDEAHATGVLGETGAGLAEAQQIAERIDITVSTASKALGSWGGIVSASRPVIDTLINRARPLIYTTAGPPIQAAVIAAALDVLSSEPGRRHRLAEISSHFRQSLQMRGWEVGNNPTPIVPLVVGHNDAAIQLASRLEDAGILAVAIRPPTVPPGSARVRLSLRADLTDDETKQVLAAIPEKH